jgi:tyrosyl-tRNA synthetase
MKPITDKEQINQVLTRRVDKIYPSKKALESLLCSGKKIRLYLGVDPTATKLHLGHAIQLRKLQEFADLGHEAILLFGTGTVLVGDPSFRETARKLITEKEILKNILTWKDQVKPIIDFNRVKIMYNSDWLLKLTLKDLINIGSKISATQLFKRENFTQRLKKGNTVLYHETMYPLLQGYDSVAMDVDLEIGGTDQTFNMLIGRELLRKMKNKEKFVVANRMIQGTDGKPMSKTSGNCIWLTDSPQDMYGKIMKLQDGLIPDYFEFFTQMPSKKISEIRDKIRAGKENPMVFKKRLALEITADFHGQKNALQAQVEFEKVYQGRGVPSKIKTASYQKLTSNTLVELLFLTRLCPSRSEAKRLIKQGAVEVNGKKVTNPQFQISAGQILKIGKKDFLKIT